MKKILACALISTFPWTAFAQTAGGGPDELDQVAGEMSMAEAQAVELYWTAARMAAAKPMPVPMVVLDDTEADLATNQIEALSDPSALPGFSPGWRPGDAAFKPVKYYIPKGHPLYPVAAAANEGFLPQHGTAPSNPKDGPYGPFQRYTEFDPITTYPDSAHGKLFFTLPGQGNYVCSATVINRNTLITAGHCNSTGNGTFATNRIFCPSYRNGVEPTRGCWVVTGSKTSAGWHTNGDPDYDYACLITQKTGTAIRGQIGNVTGWLGRAWNFSPSQAVRTFGYAQASPFNGLRLQTTQSTEWYSYNFRAGGQASKIIGSDLTGGSSGGSWVLGWNRPGNEFADTDGNLATDPGSNWINGVNSHKRCRVNCSSPPTTTSGVYWQEMSSPPFMNTAAGDESEDILSVCFAYGGS